MDRENFFLETLEKVKSLAAGQGNCVSREQVLEAFGPLKLEEEQLDGVFDYLEKRRIGIGEPVDPDSFLSEEERDYLQDYLDELAGLPQRSEGEILAMTISAMAGEKSAQQGLVEVYLRDVADVAKLYTGQGVFLEDLIGEGNMALALGTSMLGSLEKPEEAPGMLMKLVMDAMEDHIQEVSAAESAGRRAADQVNRVADRARELAEELHRKVTPEELAAETGLSLKSIRDAMRISGYKIEDIEYAKDVL